MSLVSDIIIRVRAAIRETDANNSHHTDAEIINWIDQAKTRICLKTDILINEYSFDDGSVKDQRAYTLPVGAKTILKVTYDGDKIIPTTRREEDDKSADWDDDTDIGTPDRYFIEGNNIYLVKVPDTSGLEIKMLCFSLGEALTLSTQEIPISENLDYGIINYCIHRHYKKLKQWNEAKAYLDDFQESIFDARSLANNRIADLKSVFDNIALSGKDSLKRYRNPEEWGD